MLQERQFWGVEAGVDRAGVGGLRVGQGREGRRW